MVWQLFQLAATRVSMAPSAAARDHPPYLHSVSLLVGAFQQDHLPAASDLIPLLHARFAIWAHMGILRSHLPRHPLQQSITVLGGLEK